MLIEELWDFNLAGTKGFTYLGKLVAGAFTILEDYHVNCTHLSVQITCIV